jgi:hypothetical protein
LTPVLAHTQAQADKARERRPATVSTRSTHRDLTRHLREGYRLEAQLYQALLANAREQGRLLDEQADPARCEALCDDAELLVTWIERLERRLTPLRRLWQTREADPQARQQMARHLDAIADAIGAVATQQRLNRERAATLAVPPPALEDWSTAPQTGAFDTCPLTPMEGC